MAAFADEDKSRVRELCSKQGVIEFIRQNSGAGHAPPEEGGESVLLGSPARSTGLTNPTQQGASSFQDRTL